MKKTMTVRELMQKLALCDPNAEVYTEGDETNEVFRVAQYTNKTNPGNTVVRIGDYFENCDEGIEANWQKEEK